MRERQTLQVMMKKADLKNNRTENSKFARIIDHILNSILHVSFLILLVVVFQRLLGDSQIAFVASVFIALLISAAIMAFIKRSAMGFAFLLLVTVTVLALALTIIIV